MNFSIKPEEWKRQVVTRDGVDTNIGLMAKYIGAQASGTITTAATTGDLTFKHGALASEVVDATVGVAGVLDLTNYTTIQLVLQAINLSPNWEAWAVDLPGDFLTNISAGNGIFIVGGVAATQAKVADGISAPFLVDTSLATAETFQAGLTFNGPQNVPHANDGMSLHEIMKIIASSTFAGATDGLYIYECDDINGTKAQVAHFALASATPTTYGTGDEPLISTKGKRFVVQTKDASGAITAPKIEIFARSYHFGPGVRARRLESAR